MYLIAKNNTKKMMITSTANSIAVKLIDVAQHFSTYILNFRLLISHHAFGSGNDRNTQPVFYSFKILRF
jgi:hypothetical protein